MFTLSQDVGERFGLESSPMFTLEYLQDHTGTGDCTNKGSVDLHVFRRTLMGIPSSLDLLQHNCLLNPNPKNSGPLSCSTMPFWAVSEFLLLHTWHYSFKQLLYTNFPSCKKNIQATLKVSTREQGCSRWHVFDFGTRKWRKWDQVIFRGSLISMRVESEHSPVCADWRRAAG